MQNIKTSYTRGWRAGDNIRGARRRLENEGRRAVRKGRRVVRGGPLLRWQLSRLDLRRLSRTGRKGLFELCRIVEDAIETYRREGRPLPPSTSGRGFCE